MPYFYVKIVQLKDLRKNLNLTNLIKLYHLEKSYCSWKAMFGKFFQRLVQM